MKNNKTLETFSAFNTQLNADEMQQAKGGQGYMMIKYSTEITREGSWVTADYYENGKYSYSSTSPDNCATM